jgi:hypothetical protein
VRDRIARVRGIDAVCKSTNLPLWASHTGSFDRGPRAGETVDAPLAIVTTVDLDYSGRSASACCAAATSPMPTAIDRSRWRSSTSGREAHWPDQDPIGRTFRFDSEPAARHVGVVKTISPDAGRDAAARGLSAAAAERRGRARVYIRSSGNPSQAIGTVQRGCGDGLRARSRTRRYRRHRHSRCG